MQSISQRFQYVSVRDQLCAFQIRSRPRDAPGAVKTARGEALPFRPALESVSRPRLQRREGSQAARPELGVEASLARELARSCCKPPPPECSGGFPSGLRCKLRKRHAPHADLEVDAVEERAGQAALIG